MKQITFADKSLLVGDKAANAITAYAVALANSRSADTVTLSGYDAHGHDVHGTFVLNSGTVLMAESTRSSIPEPDNDGVVEYMLDRTRDLVSPRPAEAILENMAVYFDDL